MQKMDLFDLYNACCAVLNTQQSGHLRPQLNFVSYINSISRELLNENYGDAGKNQRIRDILDGTFLKTKNVTVVPQPGKDYDFFAFPSDYAYFGAIRAFKNENGGFGCVCAGIDILDSATGKAGKYEDPDFVAIREKFKGSSVGETKAGKIDNQNWGDAISHKLKKPSFKRVMITEMEGGFKVVPKGLGIILLDYYRYPVVAQFAYTTNTDGTINYNLGGSTQLDWPISAEPHFIAGVKQKFASITEQSDKYQQAILEKKEGKA